MMVTVPFRRFGKHSQFIPEIVLKLQVVKYVQVLEIFLDINGY